MSVEAAIAALVFAFVVLGAVYDAELSSEGRECSARIPARLLAVPAKLVPHGRGVRSFYMARYNAAAGNVAATREQLHFSSSFMGWCVPVRRLVIVCRHGAAHGRIGGKNGMLVACVGIALCNLALGLLFLGDVPLALEQPLFVALYASNVLVQGFGTSAVVKINAAWYAASERGLFAGVFNILLTSGYFPLARRRAHDHLGARDIAAGATGVMTAVGYFSTGLSGAAMGHVIGSDGYRVWTLSLVLASVLAGVFAALGSYFAGDESRGMQLLDLNERTPLSASSRRSRRASIASLSADFVASPLPRRHSTSMLLQEEP
ncbi:hypothetical protein PybrP1_011759 [[Pythium] brassicae (nom. inval.)]|nr:hypothetical protein PybrP1_011759 [[Pythium] brassicae (nom. inval.)]